MVFVHTEHSERYHQRAHDDRPQIYYKVEYRFLTSAPKFLAFTRGLYKGSRQPRWAMASQILTSAANFLTTIIVLRSLGLEEFGKFSIGFLLIMIVRNFLEGMVLTPMSVIGPKRALISATAYRGFLLTNALVFAAGSGLLLLASISTISVLLNAPWISSLGFALFVATFMSGGADFFRRYHFVFKAPAQAFGVDAVRYIIQISLLLLLATEFLPIFSPQTGLLALAAGALGGSAYGALYYGGAKWHKRFATSVWSRHWRFIKWMTPSIVLDTVQSAPLLVGSALLGEIAIGLVRAMHQLANFLNLPFNALQQIAPAMAASAYHQGGTVQLRKLLTNMTLWSVSIVIVATLFVYSLSDIVLNRMLAVSAKEALPVLMAFCLTNLLVTVRLPLIILFQVIERPVVVWAGAVVGAVVTVLITYAMIRFFGPIGIPATSVLASATAIVLFAGYASYEITNVQD